MSGKRSMPRRTFFILTIIYVAINYLLLLFNGTHPAFGDSTYTLWILSILSYSFILPILFSTLYIEIAIRSRVPTLGQRAFLSTAFGATYALACIRFVHWDRFPLYLDRYIPVIPVFTLILSIVLTELLNEYNITNKSKKFTVLVLTFLLCCVGIFYWAWVRSGSYINNLPLF